MNFKEYERRKKELIDQNLSPEEYEEEIKKLIQKLEIGGTLGKH